ncbi:hypothetical protein [Streptomyces sp. NPDC052496]|uniref:hypothetical protein n=1 Tax=Streptomyces sp. NPDC052496 TaxID=3154951 RepID=UPI003444275B
MSHVRNGDAQQHATVLRAAADAAKDTPGVAFLRPGLGDLLRGTVARTAATGPRRSGPAARDSRVTGVRADRGPGPGPWRIRVHLAVRRGHRALDVARAVRPRITAAVQEALGTAGEAAPEVAVTVTVTDIT